MNLKIAVLSGDGIGPEVVMQAKKALYAISTAFDHEFIFEDAFIGAVAIEKSGKALPTQTLNLCLNTDAILFGAIGDPKYDNDPEAKIRPEQGLLQLRQELGLYANIRPIKPYKELLDASPLKRELLEGTDLVFYRELTGGLYFGEKTLNEEGTLATDLCSYSEEEIVRISHLAFAAAQKRRKKVTLVDKANVLETSRLWRKVVKEVSKEYPEVTLDFLLVDHAARYLVMQPNRFDVILTANLFGDILSDEASVLTGSIGVLASASIGEKHAIFAPIHGTYSKVKGQNIANPFGAILSAAMMLEHFGLDKEAKKIYDGIEKAVQLKVVTQDLNPDSIFGTNEIGEFIINYILDREDLLYFNNDNVSIGRSTIV
ncbi:3-isopropylmalate dehydrogenase [Flavobacterium sp. NG2]|uniref:3-isopropylmalate dehydrogenase n=1 Tax=Flavobacterium sp. NG2 TaxID=3097547 RepID=UPI002A7FDFC7|nr:3-isopropylmalate dehydrogenase [Flavobacterium sp. NG2]WPR70873.1 3-isopropylmalate dehydrogenase [Flavobacterium sp. NG2]